MSSNNSCPFCKKTDTFSINTYKHLWQVCNHCGCASSHKKEYHPFVTKFPFALLTSQNIDRKEELISMLFGNQATLENSNAIYDYFTSDLHIQYSINSVQPFVDDIIKRYEIEVKDKNILDISGGNGHFINEFKKMGANVSITEFNTKSVEYIKSNLGIDAYHFDFNKDTLSNVIPSKKFDIIFLRAAIMFCNDLKKFLTQLKPLLNPNAKIIYTQSVLPTLGVLMRTQFDEYNYQHLYQPETLVSIHEQMGYSLIHTHSDPDQEMYVYDLDKFTLLRDMISEYEREALVQIPYRTPFSFRARDRRRHTLLFQASNC